MRSTFEILDAVMDNDQDISDEELRLCIVSMHHTTTFAFQQIAKWAAKDSTLKPIDSMLASQLWKGRATGWKLPLDKRVEPHNRPGNEEMVERRKMAKALCRRVKEGTIFHD